MNAPNIRRWQDEFLGEPSEAFLKHFFIPPTAYRVSKSLYTVGTRFAGFMHQGTVYVLDGSCSYDLGCTEVHLSKADFVELPTGEYMFSVEGDRPVELVRVWKIDELFVK